MQPPAWFLNCPIEQQLYNCSGLECPAFLSQGMLTQWNKMLRRLQKAAEVRTDMVLVPQGAALQFCRFCMNIWRAQDRLHPEV